MTYAGLAVPFLTVAVAVLSAGAAMRRPSRRWWLTTVGTVVGLLALTVAFDNLMIAVDLFRYQDDRISGVTIGLAPVEDLAWPVAAGLGLPGLALLLGPSRRSHP